MVSTFTPGPMLLETDTFLTYTPFAAAGFMRTIWSMKAVKFVSSDSTENDTLPIAATAYNLERSEIFGSVAHLVRSGVQESWEADGWRILTYAGEGHTTMVFAVRDSQVRFSQVDDSVIAETV